MDTEDLDHVNRALSPGAIALLIVGGGMLAGFVSYGVPPWYMPWGLTAWLALSCIHYWLVRTSCRVALSFAAIYLLAGPGLAAWLIDSSATAGASRSLPVLLDIGLFKTLVAIGTLVVPLIGIATAAIARGRRAPGWRRRRALQPVATGGQRQFDVQETLEQRFARQRAQREREKAGRHR